MSAKGWPSWRSINGSKQPWGLLPLAMALLFTSSCSLSPESTLSEEEALRLANQEIDQKNIELPLGTFFLRNGFDPDDRDVPGENLYGKTTRISLEAARRAGLITLQIRPSDMWGGNLNQATVASVIEPLPAYVDRSKLPAKLSVDVGTRACADVVSFSPIDGAKINDRPVFLYECRFGYGLTPFGERLLKVAREAERPLHPGLWVKEGKAKFIIEWDNFSKGYKVTTGEFAALEEKKWSEEMEKRISLLQAK